MTSWRTNGWKLAKLVYYLGHLIQANRLFNSAISFTINQIATPKLVNNMSSGIPGPSLGNLFPKLEYWGPFQPLAEKCENTIHISIIRLHC